MTYSFELLPDEPILICTLQSEFSITNDSKSYYIELASIIDNLEQPVVLISDTRLLQMSAFSEFLVAINEGSRGEHSRPHHPNLIATTIVANSDLMRLSIKGLDSEAFGNISNHVFDTLEEALDQARILIAQET